MADADRLRWNDKYGRGDYDHRPNRHLIIATPWIQPEANGVPLALDLACGAGRNALYLAELGWRVHAWDLSDAGLGLLRVRLEAQAGTDRRLSVSLRQVDLEAPDFRVPAQAYDLVNVILFLHRPLLPKIAAAVKPGGLVFYHSYLDAGRGSRHRSEHKLAPGELATYFPGWEPLYGGEDLSEGLVTLLARRPCG